MACAGEITAAEFLKVCLNHQMLFRPEKDPIDFMILASLSWID